MVKKDTSKPLVGSRQPAVGIGLLAAFTILTVFSELRAESLASKVREGNRLFAQGKYAEAETAYMDAQVNNPGKPEVLYNLGNSLIKQKKYSQGVQSLRQSADKGDKAIRENSWYNTGNALFLAGRPKDSVDAYIQALQLDPSDRDAKHNLELALLKLKQQESRHPDADSKQKDSKESDKQRSEEEPAQAGSGIGKTRREDAGRGNAGAISREQALRILDALQGRELEEQRRLRERRAKQPTNQRDW